MAAFRIASPAIETFEQIFARQVDMKHALLLPFGRSAIYFFLGASGTRGAKVILPAYNCRVVASTVVASGNIPFFVDCGKGGFNMDIEDAVRNVDRETKLLLS